MTDFLYDHREELVHRKSVLELGAGAGLPSIAAAIWGAKNVVVTDYPDEDLVENMRINVEAAKDVLPRSSASVVVQVSLSNTIPYLPQKLNPCSGTRVGCRYGSPSCESAI